MPFYSDDLYRLRQSEITKKAWQEGKYNLLRKPLESRRCSNTKCNKYFKVKPHEKKIYCGSSCAAIVNNSKRPKKSYFCTACNKQLHRAERKYCSFKCQNDSYYKQYIALWKQGLESGNRGIKTCVLSKHLRRYLLEKFGNKCFKCGWDQKNPKTLVVPLEINHIDGNAENNKEENLELICPNCHSLTPCFRNLNKGKGRSWRIKYLRNSINTFLESSALIK